jgi:hypothetical protein
VPKHKCLLKYKSWAASALHSQCPLPTYLKKNMIILIKNFWP